MQAGIVSLQWLAGHLDDSGVRIIDCRFDLANPGAGREGYMKEHIPGAVFFDLEKDMSASKQTHGGRHPLPDINEFSLKLGNAGIDETVKVVAYDDQGGMVASRLWWMLQYLGHAEAYVLDGGFSQWKDKGYPVTQEIPEPEVKLFSPNVQHHMIADINQVKSKIGQEGTILIDARDSRRYRGLEEPIDPVAGHIPGAVNYFWKDSIGEDGRWNTAEQQKQRFAGIQPTDEIIVYCGSGVSACPNVLALKQAGFSNIKLYVGSWSDWCSYPDNPVAGDGSKNR